jgi:hypothetical protein
MTINPKSELELQELESTDTSILTAKYEAYKLLSDDSTPAGKAFKLLITDGYLSDEAVRITSLLAHPSMGQFRSQLFEKLAAISHFENYVRNTVSLGAPANSEDESESEE